MASMQQESAQALAELREFLDSKGIPYHEDQNIPGGDWLLSVGSPGSDPARSVRRGSTGWGGR